MDLSSLSINGLREGILKVASNRENTYRDAARRRSSLLKDQPMGPRELAVWWVEHVAQYRGAEHLKNSARYELNVCRSFLLIKKAHRFNFA